MIMVFVCKNGHREDVFRKKPYKNNIRRRCPECAMYSYRSIKAEHSSKPKVDIQHIDTENRPLSQLFDKPSFRGVMIEALTPEPVFVSSKEQYQRLLKQTNSKERGY